MAQNKVFRGVQTMVTRPAPNRIEGFYRGTMVASLTTFEDGTRTVHLNNGGWMTATTKLRMNQFAQEFCGGAFAVSQIKREWFVMRRDSNGYLDHENRKVYHGQTITFTI